jgi:hypothetical protein
MRVFAWNSQNVEHIGKHDVDPDEARYVVEHARPPFPEHHGDGKWLVRGRTSSGRWLQVIFVYPDDADVDPDSLDPHDLIAYSDGTAQVVYVIHARNLTDAEKRATRKRG